MAYAAAPQAGGLYRTINQLIRQQAASLPPTTPCELICECGDADCASSVTLTLAEFDAICTGDNRLVLGEAHSSSEP
jgi:hypothetical protein